MKNHIWPAAMPLRLSTSRATAAPGEVSFVATNEDAMTHELVVIPLPGGSARALKVGSDGTVDESSKVAEASRSCGEGKGDGIAPGASGWVTAVLGPGTYVVLCNQPGHYAAGMYTQLTVA